MEKPLFGPGDTVYAAVDMVNDGTHADFAEQAVMVRAGARGFVERVDHVKQLLVRFEQTDGELGPAVGCWSDEVMCMPVLRRGDFESARNVYAPGGYELD